MKRRKRNSRTGTRITPIQQQNALGKDMRPSYKPPIIRYGKWIVSVFVIIACGWYIWYLSQDLPSLTRLENIDPALATHVYSADGEIIDRLPSQKSNDSTV